MNRTRNNLWQIFRAPLLLALLSIIGLVAALIGDGLLDLVSWLTLGSTLLVIAWYWSRRSG
ncbi:hypothetical protein ACRSLK_14800 [Halopseudomonas pachastrellae]|uniref:hypothetical protein n=1 Tax=Halopseudomonas pachastrellae TaxID=254161 RepID=UPI003D7D100D